MATGSGSDYVRRDQLVKARDGYLTQLAAWTGDGSGREDIVDCLNDVKDELKRLPST
jgi:hypothetical protein